MRGEEKGLGELWESIVVSIEDLSLSGCYERVNKIISMGLLNTLRRKASKLASSNIIVDAGCGPGTSTGVVKSVNPDSIVIMLDPSIRMLRYAYGREGDNRTLAVNGRFERMPLKDESVESIVAMFSYRDAVSYRKAAEEFARVLKPEGRVVILDFYRPIQPWRALLKLYLLIAVPIALLLSGCPRRLRLYRGFLDTIDRMLTYKEIIEVFGSLFEDVQVKRVVPGLGFIVASRPKRRAS